jgi:ribosomal protein S18 acetylase RimI-like enzyme
MNIRLANNQDLIAIVAFNRAMALETEGKNLILDVITQGVANLLAQPQRGFYVVAEVDGVSAGSLMITTEWSDWRDGDFWWIQSVYVKPEFRKLGVYRAMYAFVQSLAAAKPNVCGFRLYVERENITAQKTYASLGMQETHYNIFESLKPGIRFLE